MRGQSLRAKPMGEANGQSQRGVLSFVSFVAFVAFAFAKR